MEDIKTLKTEKKRPVDKREETPSFKSREEGGRVYVTEGKAEISFPSNAVFYNPVQEFNRDLSIAAINTWSKIFLTERIRGKKGRKDREFVKKDEIKTEADAATTPSDSTESAPPITEPMDTDTPSTSSNLTDPPPILAPAAQKQTKAARRREKRTAQDLEHITNPLRWMDTFTEIDLDAPSSSSSSPEPNLSNQKFKVLEALSASGLRSIRYAKELDHVGSIVANDLLPTAVDAIEGNARHNGVEDLVRASQGDASFVMYKALASNERFDVIDLDPYGGAAQFLDGAVQAVSEGGLLCVTCTDLAVLAGGQPEACYAKYGGMPIPNSPYCHEMALRLVLHTLSTTASRYKRYIVPLASFSIDFYVRLFVRVYTSPALVKGAAGKTAVVYHCSGCKAFELQQLGKAVGEDGNGRGGPIVGPPVGRGCEHCGKSSHLGGPFWSAPIHDREFLKEVIRHVKAAPEKYGTNARILGMLTVAFEELPIPFYYTLPSLTSVVHSNTPSLTAITSAILHAGYKVSISHAMAGSVKTNAPASVMWDIMRKWVELNPVKAKDNLNAPGSVILAKERTLDVNFERHPKADPESRKVKLVRFQFNPTKNWGPLAKPGAKEKPNKQQKGQKRRAEEAVKSEEADTADGTKLKKPKLEGDA
ncbi:tRNA methyltransferase 1 [Rhizophlyctis rosea]|uniref:tRNA (guanine(26)-N(2))-dimethyltransferase n=1 Tax=Rhizophlyctis rosea TaxID=64517 RepID=A0AAD5WXA1_9FUNG|nr:tRNA methyltransferase 1 [Rhizophlyctis rosea]